MIEVRRKEKETVESLIRRFNRRIQQSRILAVARQSRFRREEKSREERRQEALYKERLRAEIERYRKMGRTVDPETLREIKKRLSEEFR